MFEERTQFNCVAIDLPTGGFLQRVEYTDGSLVIRVSDQEQIPLDNFIKISRRVKEANYIARLASFSEPSTGDTKETLAAIVNNGIHNLLMMPFVMDAYHLALAEMGSVRGLLDSPLGLIDTFNFCGHEQPLVVAFFPGYHQFPGAGAQFMADASEVGIQGLSKGYNYTMAPEEFSERVLLPLIADVEKAGGVLAGAVGHSTGADNLRYALIHDCRVRDYAYEHDMRFVFSSPLTTGIDGVLTPAQRRLMWMFSERDNLRTLKGMEQFAKLNQPLPRGVKAYTLLCQNDQLVPPRCGMDTNNGAVNVMIPGGGHFLGSGIGTYVNNASLYLLINGVPELK